MAHPVVAPVLTPQLAQEIAGDTTDIIGFNVLITDRDGIVIGSGERARVGTFHEASIDVVRTQRSATHNAAEAHQMRGVRPGITLPIVIGDTAVGTVGITGSPVQVRRFGLVVKRQTEILLQESGLLRSRLVREQALDELVRDIAHFSADLGEPDLVAYRAAELGYDLGGWRIAVVVDISAPSGGGAHPAPADPDDAVEPTLRLSVLGTIRALVAGPDDIAAAMPSNRFVVLHRVRPAGASSGDSRAEGERESCARLVDQIGRRHGLDAVVGIGTPAATIAGLHDSYQDASTAARLGRRLPGRPAVNTIDELRIHQLLAATGQQPRNRFVDALTARLRAESDWPALRETVLTWCDSGFNLVRAANALQIHRNTMVYRLKRISRLTDRPLGDHRATLALYLACLAEQLD
ncbi:CdaR family transcriptional regulator [Paractinoplanes globisporus]|uniref:CdaR family transcriptional regulator n=1 Tax=Paractinoplanes globisporus TaxID=113565 RepID=A0ABW6W8S6_9ACTN|nr:sugar diacid recognition domain-containing protein [Actinoplanes globisporus]